MWGPLGARPVWRWTTSMPLSLVGMIWSNLASRHLAWCCCWECPSSGGDGCDGWGDNAGGCSLVCVIKGSFSSVSSRECDVLPEGPDVSLMRTDCWSAATKAVGCCPGWRPLRSAVSGFVSSTIMLAELPFVEIVMEALSGRKVIFAICNIWYCRL